MRVRRGRRIRSGTTSSSSSSSSSSDADPGADHPPIGAIETEAEPPDLDDDPECDSLGDIGREVEPGRTDGPADADGGSDVDGSDTGGRASDGAWIQLAAGILFVLAVAGSFSYLMRDELATTSGGDQTAFQARAADSFDRTNDLETLGANGQGQEWQPVRGTWGVDVGKAILVESADNDPNVILLVNAAVGSVAADVGGSGQCGVVARYTSEDDYIALQRVPAFGVWSLERRSGGETEQLATLLDADGSTVRVVLEVGQRTATMRINAREASVALDIEEAPLGGSFGLISTGANAGSCTWDDVQIDTSR
ncbi:hypothetical protein [Ilumatobacter sp.]|uniref:hypothetical protein n=1 Tax=Ilumatobacter sp. TaxID=1967498 RepID=UPI003C30EDDA